MADGVTVKVEGIADLSRALDELRVDLRKKVVRGALRDAAKPIVLAARAGAPILQKATSARIPGVLRKAINVRSSKIFRGRDGVIGVYVGVTVKKGLRNKKGQRKTPFDPFYGRFLERGTQKMGKRPFLLPAFNAQGGAALRIFAEKIRARIAKANSRK